MFLGDCVNFTCNGWKILFLIKELALKELCFNFFSTVSFAANTIDPQYVSALAFCLGGQSWERGLAELAWRMGLYEQQEAMSHIFDIFFISDARDYSTGVNGYGFCKTIENGGFH